MYAVAGMTCSHCVNAVRSEISGIPGVAEVEVDLAGGTVTIRAEPAPSAEAVRAAIEAAGYELVG